MIRAVTKQKCCRHSSEREAHLPIEWVISISRLWVGLEGSVGKNGVGAAEKLAKGHEGVHYSSKS